LTKKILQIDPASLFWKFVLGYGYYKNHQFEKSVEYLNPLYQGRWKHVWLYYFLGRMHQEKLVGADPGGLACAIEANQIDKAIAVYETGLEVNPQWITFNAWLSAAYFLKGDSGKAEEYYEYFLMNLSDSKDNAGEQYREAGEMFRRVQKYDSAIECLKKSLITNPGEVDSFYWLGRVYETTGDSSQAIKSFETFIKKQKIGPNVDDARIRLRQL